MNHHFLAPIPFIFLSFIFLSFAPQLLTRYQGPPW